MTASAFAESELLLPSSTSVSQGESKRVRFATPEDDAQVKKTVESIIASAKFESSLVTEVNNGIVVLSGEIKQKDQVEWLAKAIDRLPSVVAVVNRTTTSDPPWTDTSPITNESKRILNVAKKHLPQVGIGLIMATLLFFIGYGLSRVAQRAWGSHIQNPFLLSIVTKLTMVPLWALFFFITLNAMGLTGIAATIVGGTGLLGIVLGFAFKGIAENYLSGILLAIKSPFTKGDSVIIDNWSGTVQGLSMRGTTIIDSNGVFILIPNAIVIQSVIQNKSVSPTIREKFTVPVAASESAEKVESVILAALSKVEEVAKNPAPSVALDSASAQIARYDVYFWCDNKKYNNTQVRSKAIEYVMKSLLREKVEMSNPSRSVSFSTPIKVIEQSIESFDKESIEREQEEELKTKDRVEDEKTRSNMTLQKTNLELKQQTLPHEGAEGNLLK